MSATQTYGANIAFIEELYDKYRNNPNEVSPSWREFFNDYQPEGEELEAAEEQQQEVGKVAVATAGRVEARPAPPAPTPAPP
ncbi:MAG TPA: hypothetical protein VJ276_00180, partial [Thermoanaerobaculia bacterium]|nr:hypothetical protein [Thermoanaerobaculia bacterium]